MSSFTPEQINEILEIFLQHYGHTQYVGARYVPIFGRKGEDSIIWDNSKPYEPLTIVLHEGNSYTSRQFVPVGIDILNEAFWANTGNYNAQVEAYRQEVITYNERVTDEIAQRIYEDSIRPISFPNVAAMINSDDIKTGMICHTNGFYDSGDGGSAWYEIKATGPANDMDIIQCGSVYAHLIIESEMHCECFGITANSNTDLSDKINYASNKTALIFTEGEYLINKTLDLKNDVSGIGDVEFRTIDNDSFVYAHAQRAIIYIDNALTVKNITLDGQSATLFPDNESTQYGIVVSNGARGCLIDNVTIENIASCGIIIWSDDATEIKLNSINTSNCGVGFSTEKWGTSENTQMHNIILENSHIVGSCGLSQHGVDGFTAVNCMFESTDSRLANEVRISDALGITRSTYINCLFIWSGSIASGGRALQSFGYRKSNPGTPGVTDYTAPGCFIYFINCKFLNDITEDNKSTHGVMVESVDKVSFENCEFNQQVIIQKNANASVIPFATVKNCTLQSYREDSQNFRLSMGVDGVIENCKFLIIPDINARGVSISGQAYVSILNCDFTGYYLACNTVSNKNTLLFNNRCDGTLFNASQVNSYNIAALNNESSNNIHQIIATTPANLDAVMANMENNSIVFNTTDNSLNAKISGNVYKFSHD